MPHKVKEQGLSSLLFDLYYLNFNITAGVNLQCIERYIGDMCYHIGEGVNITRYIGISVGVYLTFGRGIKYIVKI